jgi:hypothetical protein
VEKSLRSIKEGSLKKMLGDATTEWLWRGLISLLLVGNWYWVKRYIASNDKWKQDLDERSLAFEEKGGIVTRDKHFEWCKDAMTKCSAGPLAQSLTDWRQQMYEKGGALTKAEHTELCKEVAGVFGDRVSEIFSHHREIMAQEMKLVRTELSKDLLKSMADLKREIINEISQNGSARR